MKTTTNVSTPLFLAILFAFFTLNIACEPTEATNPEPIEPAFQFEPTWIVTDIVECCNIWDGMETDKINVEEIVADFLQNKNIFAIQTWIDEDGTALDCHQCCGCPTGQRVKIEIRGEELGSALQLGFSEL